VSGDHSEIWDYIMDTREAAGITDENIAKLDARIAALETRLHDHEQAVPHAEAEA
jgi:hypothetical protein